MFSFHTATDTKNIYSRPRPLRLLVPFPQSFLQQSKVRPLVSPSSAPSLLNKPLLSPALSIVLSVLCTNQELNLPNSLAPSSPKSPNFLAARSVPFLTDFAARSVSRPTYFAPR